MSWTGGLWWRSGRCQPLFANSFYVVGSAPARSNQAFHPIGFSQLMVISNVSGEDKVLTYSSARHRKSLPSPKKDSNCIRDIS